MLKINHNPSGFYEVIVSGEINSQEYKEQLAQFTKEINATDKKINIVKIVENFDGLENWTDPIKNLKESLSMWPKINKAAIVTDMKWASKLVDLLDSITSAEFKAFDLAHKDDAYSWISKQ